MAERITGQQKKSERQIEWENFRNKVWEEAPSWGKPDYRLSLGEVEDKYHIRPIPSRNIAYGEVRETGQEIVFIKSPQRGSEFIPEIQLKAKEKELSVTNNKDIPIVVVTEEVGNFKEVNARGYTLAAGYLGSVYFEQTRNGQSFSRAKRDLRYYGIPSRYLREGSLEVTTNGVDFQKGSLLRFFVEPNLHTGETWDILKDPDFFRTMRIEGTAFEQILKQANLQAQLNEIVTNHILQVPANA